MEYKESEAFLQRSAQGKANAALKKYHHVMGTSGYKGAMPKWEKTENDLIAKGINPEPLEWAERAKSWFYGYGGKLNPETGKCIFTKKHLATPYEALKTAMKDVQ